MTPTAELSAPEKEAEKQQTDRPPPQEPQDGENDRHGASSRVNVMNIYFGTAAVVKSLLRLRRGARSPAMLNWNSEVELRNGLASSDLVAQRPRVSVSKHAPALGSVGARGSVR